MSPDPLLHTEVAQRTTAAVLDEQATVHGDRTAVVDEDGRSLTFSQLRAAAHAFAGGLDRLGVGRQEPVLIMLGNHVDHVVAWLGTTASARIHVPLNTAFKGELLAEACERSGARVLVLDDEWVERLRDLGPAAQDLTTVVVRGTRAVPGRFERADFDQAFRSPADPPADPPAAWDVASLLFTSGTEGGTKAIVSPHGHGFAIACSPFRTQAEDVVLVVLPLFHAAGLLAGVYNALRAGAAAVVARTFSVRRFWSQVRRHECTITRLLGAQADFLWRHPPSDDELHSSLKLITITPAPLDPRAIEARFGVEVASAYGLGEAGTLCISDPGAVQPMGIGRPRSFVEMRVVDENCVDVADGEVGEIVVRTSEPWSMMHGYHQMPEATLAAWRDHWFHTGDSAYRDSGGHLVFADRKKDVIRRRGENVSSHDVERHMLNRPDIEDVAVVGVPSENTEDELKAVIVLATGHSFEPVEIIRDLYGRMPYFMVPRYLECVDELPRTPTHKVKKAELRASGISDATWDSYAAGLVPTRDRLIESEESAPSSA